MSERILIESIKALRTLDPDDKVHELAVDIRDNGQQLPVLVREDHVLIDGLRRLEAVKLLGHDTVDAVVATTLMEAVDVITEAHKDGPPKQMRRIWEIKKALDPLIVARAKWVRQQQTGRKRKEPYSPQKGPRFRETAIAMFGGYKAVNKIWDAYVLHESGRVEGSGELIRALEAGELTPNQVYGRLSVKPPFRGNVTDARQQRQLIESASRNLSGLIHGLDKLGEPIKIAKAEGEPLLKELRISRGRLYRIIRLLEEAVNQND